MHDFGAETQQSTDILYKNIDLKVNCRLILFSLIIAIILIIAIDSAEQILKVSANIKQFIFFNLNQLIVEPFH